MDTSQLLLTVTLTVTTLFLIITGLQLIFVLRELRKTLRKVNNIIEGFEKMGTSVEHGFSEFVGLFSGIKTLFNIFKLIESKRNDKPK